MSLVIPPVSENTFDEDVDDHIISSPKTAMNVKLIRAMKKLQASYNDEANKVIKDSTHVIATKNLNFLINLAMVTTNYVPVPEEPASFNKALNHPNTTSWEKWQEAICNEFANMNKQ